MAQGQLLGDHPAHRDTDDMCGRESHMVHQSSAVVGQQRDAVVHVWFVTHSGASLVERQDAKLACAGGSKVSEHGLIALCPVNHNERFPRSLQLVTELNSVNSCALHIISSLLNDPWL